MTEAAKFKQPYRCPWSWGALEADMDGGFWQELVEGFPSASATRRKHRDQGPILWVRLGHGV
jgi:hypothetical protein